MAQQRRALKERLGLVNANPVPNEPVLNIPPSDEAAGLAEAAKGGFAAIESLFADRNRSVEMAQSLHRHNVYLLNVNNGLRAQNQHLNMKCEYLMKMNARLGAWLEQARDLFSRIASETGAVTHIIEQMPSTPQVTNMPEAPPVDNNGLPHEGYDPPTYDKDGIPTPPDAEELRQLAARLSASASGEV